MKRTREPRDFYATPAAAFLPLLELLPKGPIFWDPACGDRRLIEWLRESGREAFGNDLTQGVDFLQDRSRREFLITNPPFSLAFEFCLQALTVAPEVCLLLRLNFLASQGRSAWWRVNEPNALFVLSNRPNFVMSCSCKAPGCGHKWTLPINSDRPRACPQCAAAKPAVSTSDNCDYAWFYWGWRFKGIRHL